MPCEIVRPKYRHHGRIGVLDTEAADLKVVVLLRMVLDVETVVLQLQLLKGWCAL